ncbi:hypothetical protein CFIMG_001298RA [Ceratocystis fimbriata CBS 114723]|uniref:Uncharacterized protein n=1 Tax=Ceratocystis fimbriata CBS 114723 TaxID=1035309 RepID=A0A2C5XEE5_9PEZI|nr:hypothetical protein CFIMG_001298RA [Ceratocystis fimbriata CBS 114723]
MKFLYAIAAATMAIAPSSALPIHRNYNPQHRPSSPPLPAKVSTIGLPPSIPAELKSVIFVDEDTSKMDAVDAESRGPRQMAHIEFDVTTFVLPPSTDVEVINAIIAKFSPPKSDVPVTPAHIPSTEAFMAAYRKEAALRGLHPHYRRPSAYPHSSVAAATAAAAAIRNNGIVSHRPQHRKLASVAAAARAFACHKYRTAATTTNKMNMQTLSTSWMKMPWGVRLVLWFSMCFTASLVIVAGVVSLFHLAFGSRLPGSIRLEVNEQERNPKETRAVAAAPSVDEKSAAMGAFSDIEREAETKSQN